MWLRPVIVAGVFVVLASIYSLVTPLHESYDEPGHFAYAYHLAAERALPDLATSGRVKYAEAHQPPLYYVLVSLPMFLLGPPEYTPPRLNEQDQWRDSVLPLAQVLHRDAREGFEGWGKWAFYLGRFVSILVGAGNVVLTYHLARLVVDSPRVATTAALLVAFTPMVLYISAVLNNDGGVATLATLTLLLTTRVVVRQSLTWRSATAIGLALGLALLTKRQALALVPFVAWATLLLSVRSRQHREVLLCSLWSYAVAAGLTTWWLVRFVAHTGSVAEAASWLTYGVLSPGFVPQAIGAFLSVGWVLAVPLLVGLVYGVWRVSRPMPIRGNTRLDRGGGAVWGVAGSPWLVTHLGVAALAMLPLGARMLLVLQGEADPLRATAENITHFYQTYWGAFGSGLIFYEPWVYAAFAAVLLLGGSGLVLDLCRSKHRASTRSTALVFGLYAVLLGATVFAYLWGAYVAGRYALGLAAPICVGLAVGLHHLARYRWLRWLPAGVVALLGALAVATPFWVIAPQYALPERLPPGAPLPAMERVDVTFGDRIRLIGYQLDRQRARPGETFELKLFLQALRPVEGDYPLVIALGGVVPDSPFPAALVRTQTGRGLYPTSRWREGEVIVDRYVVRVRESAPPDQIWRLVVGFDGLQARDSVGNRLGSSVPLAFFHVVADAEVAPPGARFEHPIAFGDSFELVAADLKLEQGGIRARLWWRILAAPREPLSTFVHLTQSLTGAPVATGDAPLLYGALAPALWAPGDLAVDDYRLAIPEGVAPGRYFLLVGLYRSGGGGRLPAVRGDGVALDANAAVLGEVFLQENGTGTLDIAAAPDRALAVSVATSPHGSHGR